MADRLAQTLAELSDLSRQHAAVAVAFSGGKDSLVTLDLALRFFPRVYPFYKYFVPGLEFDAQRMRYAKQRFGLDVLQYPHQVTLRAFKTATYVDPLPEFDLLPDLDARDLYDIVKHDTGATLVLNGEKKADGIFRRRNIANRQRTETDVYRPLKEWVRWEVLSYLNARNIALPSQAQADNAGISLSNKEVLFLYDNHRSDYELIKSYFPYIETIVLRRDWFNRTDG